MEEKPKPPDTEPLDPAVDAFSPVVDLKIAAEATYHVAGAAVFDRLGNAIENRSDRQERSSEFYKNLGAVALGHLNDPENVTSVELNNPNPPPQTRAERRAHDRAIQKGQKVDMARLRLNQANATFGVHFGHGEAGKASRLTRKGREYNRTRREYTNNLREDYRSGAITREQYNSRMAHVKYGIRQSEEDRSEYFALRDPKGVKDAKSQLERKARKVESYSARLTNKGFRKERASLRNIDRSFRLYDRSDQHRDRVHELDREREEREAKSAAA